MAEDDLSCDDIYDSVLELIKKSPDFDGDPVMLKNAVIIADVQNLNEEKGGGVWQKVWLATASMDGREVPPWTVVGLADWTKNDLMTMDLGEDDDD